MKLGLICSTVLAMTFTIGLSVGGCDMPPGNQVPPETNARQWAGDLGLQVAGLSCAQLDSDGDGYVTCTVRLGGDHPELKSVQCAAVGSYRAQGCKLTVQNQTPTQ